MEASWANRAAIWQVAVCGLIGVQLFFVLSGFLIGRILIALIEVDKASHPRTSNKTGTASWRRWLIFMVRRWMRTLPLYWLVLLLLGWFWPPMFWVPHNGLLRSHLLAYGSLTQNLFWPMRDGWFAVSWSLAVEEWFYLVFSALLFASARLLTPGRALATTLLLFIATPLVLRYYSLADVAWQSGDEQIVPLWFDALATGVLTSWLLYRSSMSRSASLFALVLGLSLVTFVWSGGLGWLAGLGRPMSRDLNYELLSLGFAFCIPGCLTLRHLPAPLDVAVRWLSKWSYCLYLTHLSVLEIGGYYGQSWGVAPISNAVVCLVLTFVASWFSWRFFEGPILRLRPVDSVVAAPSS